MTPSISQPTLIERKVAKTSLEGVGDSSHVDRTRKGRAVAHNTMYGRQMDMIFPPELVRRLDTQNRFGSRSDWWPIVYPDSSTR
jgi:hypothetical protein